LFVCFVLQSEFLLDETCTCFIVTSSQLVWISARSQSVKTYQVSRTCQVVLINTHTGFELALHGQAMGCWSVPEDDVEGDEGQRWGQGHC
jgi:hypothetical protein